MCIHICMYIHIYIYIYTYIHTHTLCPQRRGTSMSVSRGWPSHVMKTTPILHHDVLRSHVVATITYYTMI